MLFINQTQYNVNFKTFNNNTFNNFNSFIVFNFFIQKFKFNEKIIINRYNKIIRIVIYIYIDNLNISFFLMNVNRVRENLFSN